MPKSIQTRQDDAWKQKSTYTTSWWTAMNQWWITLLSLSLFSCFFLFFMACPFNRVSCCSSHEARLSVTTSASRSTARFDIYEEGRGMRMPCMYVFQWIKTLAQAPLIGWHLPVNGRVSTPSCVSLSGKNTSYKTVIRTQVRVSSCMLAIPMLCS